MSGIEPDRRRWRKKGRRNGAAVKVSCRPRHKETLGTARGPRSGSSPSAPAKKRHRFCGVFFIQSEGLVCNRRQAYVISSQCELYVIKASALYVFFFGLITCLSSKGLHTVFDGLHTSLRDDYIQGFALIVCLTAQ